MSVTSWMRRLNHSFVHGALAYSAYAWGPAINGIAGWILAALVCAYAGWFRQACLVSFLGGVIVAVVVLTAVGALSLPGNGFGVFFMVPFALLVILPMALAGYLAGWLISTIVHRQLKAL